MEGGAGKIAILSTLSTNHKARKKKNPVSITPGIDLSAVIQSR